MSQETLHFKCFQFSSGPATWFVPGNLTPQLSSILVWPRHWVFVSGNLRHHLISVLFWLRQLGCLRKPIISAVFSFVPALPLIMSRETLHFKCFQFCSDYAIWFVQGNLTLQLFSILFWLHLWVCPRKPDTSAVFNFVLTTPLGLSQETWHFSCFLFCSDTYHFSCF